MPEIVPPELLARTTPIAFYGYAHAKPGKYRTLLDRMLELGPPSRNEPGVLVYEIHHDATRFDSVAFYELYADGEALRTHIEQPYMVAFFEDCTSMLRTDLEIIALDPIRP